MRTGVGVAIVGRDRRYLFTNRAFATIVYAGESPVGLDAWNTNANSRYSQLDLQCEQVLREGTVREFEDYRAMTDQWLAIVATPCDRGIAVYATDISPLRRSERTLAHLLAIHQRSSDASAAQPTASGQQHAEGIAETSFNGRVVSMNPHLATMLGYVTADEALASAIDFSALGGSPDIWASLAVGTLQRAEFDIPGRDGHGIRAWVSLRCHKNRIGAIVGMRAFVDDISQACGSMSIERESPCPGH